LMPMVPTKPAGSPSGGQPEPPSATSTSAEGLGEPPSVEAEPTPPSENRGDLPTQEDTAPPVEN
jgi:hypothetical protein